VELVQLARVVPQEQLDSWEGLVIPDQKEKLDQLVPQVFQVHREKLVTQEAGVFQETLGFKAP
jgi:hypothetical protein